MTITTKGGPASDIGQQQADSNVCAFSSVLFLFLAISTLFSVLAEAEGDEQLDVSAALSERLLALKVSSSEYAEKRMVATRDVARLRKEYLKFCATARSEENAAPARPVAEARARACHLPAPTWWIFTTLCWYISEGVYSRKNAGA